MRAVVQRVTEASVSIGGETVGAIKNGLCVLLGVSVDDTEPDADYISDKLIGLRIFDDENGVPTEERIFTVNEVMEADEIFVCSTTKNAICVFEIDGKPVGGKDRALATRIQDLLWQEIYAQTGAQL